MPCFTFDFFKEAVERGIIDVEMPDLDEELEEQAEENPNDPMWPSPEQTYPEDYR